MNLHKHVACLVLGAIAVSGCSAALASKGRSDLAKQCAAMGENMRFLPGETRRADNPIFSSASVTGQCVGPDHPDYANALAPKESTGNGKR